MNQPYSVNDLVVRVTEYGHKVNVQQVTKVQGVYLELNNNPNVVWSIQEVRHATQQQIDNQYTH